MNEIFRFFCELLLDESGQNPLHGIIAAGAALLERDPEKRIPGRSGRPQNSASPMRGSGGFSPAPTKFRLPNTESGGASKKSSPS